MDGGRWGLPDTPLYLIAKTNNQRLLVPCFTYSEAAMVEWYLLGVLAGADIFIAKPETFPKRRGPFLLAPGIVRDAADWVKQKKVKKHSSKVSGRAIVYLIASTSRRILTPLHLKTNRDIIREQIRKGT